MLQVYEHGRQAPSGSIGGFAELVSCIGKSSFGRELISLLNAECSAEHCAVLSYENEGPRRIVSVSSDGTDSADNSIDLYLKNRYVLRDETIAEARRQFDGSTPAMIRVDVSQILDADFRNTMYRRANICERVLIYGGTEQEGIGISVLRTHALGPFLDDQLSWLNDTSAVLLSIVSKHAEVERMAACLGSPLSSLEEIEAVLASAPIHLSHRESQVCARILFNLCVTGIATDLGIGEESVSTYRKRAFQRLDIATRHELLVWYLDLWRKTRAS